MASSMIRTSVHGTAELQRKLRKLSTDAQGIALDLATQAGGEVVRTQAVVNAPYKSGTLRRSLNTKKDVDV